jgi:hypothetical protein
VSLVFSPDGLGFYILYLYHIFKKVVLVGSCCCACGGAGDGVGVTTGTGEAAASTTLSTGGGGGGGGSGPAGTGEKPLKTETAKSSSIIKVPHKKSITLYSGIQN